MVLNVFTALSESGFYWREAGQSWVQLGAGVCVCMSIHVCMCEGLNVIPLCLYILC